MDILQREFEGMKYVVRLPEGYEEGEKHPVLIYLHGAGTRGSNIYTLTDSIVFRATRGMENFPFVIAAPLCNADSWFDIFETLKKFAVKIALESFADRERIYLAGTSMGGYGTWQLAMSLPELFAAIVPVCGGGMYWNAGRLVNVPVWAFHGGRDKTVFPEESQKMVDAVNRRGGNAKLTLYPENEHNAWDDTYTNEEVYRWLLSHKNSNTKPIEDIYNDSKVYG